MRILDATELQYVGGAGERSHDRSSVPSIGLTGGGALVSGTGGMLGGVARGAAHGAMRGAIGGVGGAIFGAAIGASMTMITYTMVN
jgi:hypothetical protein